MSAHRRQAHLGPRVIEVDGERFEEGDEYAQVTKDPLADRSPSTWRWDWSPGGLTIGSSTGSRARASSGAGRASRSMRFAKRRCVITARDDHPSEAQARRPEVRRSPAVRSAARTTCGL